MIETDIRRFGQYVVIRDLTDSAKRGFIFDGDSCVADLDHEIAARHDWDYLIGTRKLTADWRYTWGYIKDQRPLRALIRFCGLSIFGHIPYRHHRARRKEWGLETLLAERMVPHSADDSVWDWNNNALQKSWLLQDLLDTTKRFPKE